MEATNTKIIVNPEGPLTTCKIALIGEAPGETEEKLGRPFIGSSGKDLTRYLSSAGIIREECYIDNVILERPPTSTKKKNDISCFIDFNKRVPTYTDEYVKYKSMLRERLEQCSANVIVALGNTALYTLCDKWNGITKWRGSILNSTLLPNRKVIPIIHPRAAQEMYNYSYFIIRDLQKVKRQSEFSEIRLPARSILIEPSFVDTMSYVKECMQLSRIAFDIEVINGKVSCISIAKSAYDVISIPFVANKDSYFSAEQELEVWIEIAKLLESPYIEKIGQNLTFDATTLLRDYGISVKNIHDTMVGFSILYPEFPKGLDFLTSWYTDEPYYKEDGKKWFKFGGSDVDFWIYNAKDSAVCMEIFPLIESDLIDMKNTIVYDRQRKLIEPLTYISERGIKIDMDYLLSERENIIKERDKAQEELNNICGYEVNVSSITDMQEYFYESKGIHPYRKKGRITTDVGAMKQMKAKGHKEAELVLTIRHNRTLLQTFFEPKKIDTDGRLRCSMNPVGAADTGRLSSSENIFGTGMNMQNLPESFRKCLLADDEYIMYSLDLEQAEDRIVAVIAPESRKLEAYRLGKDPHRLTAGLIFFKNPEDISDEQGSSPLGDGKHSERYWGKTAGHGINYDYGEKNMAIKYEIDRATARYLKEAYLRAYPGVIQYHNWVQEKGSRTRYLLNCMERNRLFTGRYGNDLFREMYAFIPQSTVSDIINERGVEYIYYNPDLFRPIELLDQIHDEIVFQIPLSIPFEQHRHMLNMIITNLEKLIYWKSDSFIIPVGVKIGLRLSKKDMINVEREDSIEAKYRELISREEIK